MLYLIAARELTKHEQECFLSFGYAILQETWNSFMTLNKVVEL